MDSEKLIIGYIAASGHSGSTLTDLLLGSQPRIAGFGELKNLSDVQQGRIAKGLCTCGAKLDKCHVWAPVLNQMVRKGLSLDMNDPTHPDFIRFSEVMFYALQKQTDSDAIVESSKGLKRFELFAKVPSFEPKLLHIVRDGRAVAYSNQRKGRDLMESLKGWMRQQENILKFKNNFLNDRTYLRVKYEDIASNPSEKVSEMVTFLTGHAPEFIDLDWAEHTRHNIGGNRMRRGESSSIEADIKYLTALSETEWADAWDVCGQVLERLGYFSERRFFA
jgi:hypothetical protein